MLAATTGQKCAPVKTADVPFGLVASAVSVRMEMKSTPGVMPSPG